MRVHHHHDREAFTLIELLIVIAVIGIVSAMLGQALVGATRHANETRAESFINSINLMVMQIYTDRSERTISGPSSFRQSREIGAGGTTTANYTAAIQNNGRASKSKSLAILNWKRDYLRCTLPDRIRDVTLRPIDVQYGVYPAGSSTAGLVRLDPSLTGTWQAPHNRYLGSVRFRAQEIIQTRVAQLITIFKGAGVLTYADCVDANPANGDWTVEHQGAECLYLIFSTHMINGEPAIQSINDRDIGDTDEDGVPEILDPWGTPVGYLRWPSGLALLDEVGASVPSGAELHELKSQLGRDNMDLLYSDPRYVRTAATDDRKDDPFPLMPIVVSAGLDGVFDMVGLDDPSTPDVSYATELLSNLPGDPDRLTFPAAQKFIDPYLYSLPINEHLGAAGDTADVGTDNRADNIIPAFKTVIR